MRGFGMGRNRNERRPGVEARATTADVRQRSARSARYRPIIVRDENFRCSVSRIVYT
ncbi:uncharacterized protein BCN122_II3091 [Burkholderia cenocepacia]|nr:uncharacterized protein BCN122_II3091 [Burkholderia cenocepacia]